MHESFVSTVPTEHGNISYVHTEADNHEEQQLILKQKPRWPSGGVSDSRTQ